MTADDRLATLNQATSAIEYQHYTDRVSKEHSGAIAMLECNHSNCAITLNHRMWVSPARRSAATGFSTAYSESRADWSIRPLHELIDDRRSHFHVRLACEGARDPYAIDDDVLVLMGAYISEGCVGKRLSDGTASLIRISQKDGGRLCSWMVALQLAYGDRMHRYEHVHTKNRANSCKEVVWTLADRDVAKRLEAECGSLAENKRLPRWTRELSREQALKLLRVMCDGDGTPHGDGWVYYTTSQRLADDIQAMCVSSGIVSAVWGPYPNGTNRPMFQVFVGLDGVPPVASVVIRLGRASCEVTDVRDARVVCFTVPNETLITRRNGKVAIHGNTKHAMHLVRLATHGDRNPRERRGARAPRRSRGPLAIRDGAWSYEELAAASKRMAERAHALRATSKLPAEPDYDALNRLCARDRRGGAPCLIPISNAGGVSSRKLLRLAGSCCAA